MNGAGATNVEMNVALWFVSIAMGLAFAGAGVMKLVLSKKRLVRGAGWIEDFSLGTVRFVGLTEMMGGAAIILPAVINIPSRLVLPAGIAGLIVVMLGAAVVHARRREPGMIVLNLVLLALATATLWGRPSY
jgi:hypothetical protein